MPAIDLKLDGDKCWPDLLERMKRPCTLGEASGLGVAVLDAGMTSGAPSVTLRLDFDDGSSRIVQTSVALLFTAVDAIRVRYGDPRG